MARRRGRRDGCDGMSAATAGNPAPRNGVVDAAARPARRRRVQKQQLAEAEEVA